MIVAHWQDDGQLIVFASEQDFQDEHAWRWPALEELAAAVQYRAWGPHHRLRYQQEVELAVLMLLAPCLHGAQGKAGAPWVLPSRVYAEEVLRKGRYPEPSKFFVTRPGQPLTSTRLEQSREQAQETPEIEQISDATLLYEDDDAQHTPRELPLD